MEYFGLGARRRLVCALGVGFPDRSPGAKTFKKEKDIIARGNPKDHLTLKIAGYNSFGGE